MLWSRVKKIDDVPHVSLDEHSNKTDQNEGAGAQWTYWKNIDGSKYSFPPHFHNLHPNLNIFRLFDVIMFVWYSWYHMLLI